MDKTSEPNPLPRLYSPEDVRAMFPENRRPSVRTVIQKAKLAGCCCKLGRGIGFTKEQVDAFIAYFTTQDIRHAFERPKFGKVVPLKKPGSTYLQVRALLTEGKTKHRKS